MIAELERPSLWAPRDPDPALWGIRVYLAVLPTGQTGRWDVGLWDMDRWDSSDWLPVEATRDCIALDFTRGRRDPLSRYSAGTASLRLWNEDGKWSPWVRVEAGYAALDAGLPFAVTFDTPEGPLQLFTGRAEELGDDFTPSPGGTVPERAWVDFAASDGFAYLARNRPPTLATPVGAGESSGARILRILEAARWPFAARVDGGAAAMQGITFSRSSLEECYLTADTEAAELYCGADGLIVYEQNGHADTDPRQNTPQLVLTDRPGDEPDAYDPPLPDVPRVGYARCKLATDRTQLVNSASVANAGGTAQRAEVPASIGRYGPCTWQRHDLLATSDANSTARAAEKVRDWAFASRHIDGITLYLGTEQSWASTPAARLAACSLELGDRVRVIRHYPSGQVVDLECCIGGITHRITPGDWTCELATGRILVTHRDS